MRPHAQPSDTEEAKWRTEFEKLGRETVRVAILRGQGFTPDRKRELAILWLREKEAAAEDRERDAYWYLKWTFVAATAAAVFSFVVMLAELPSERINAMLARAAELVEAAKGLGKR
jgi:hypothetical protein